MIIRRFHRFEAPLALTREVFSNADAWPDWMPGIDAVRTLEEREGRVLVEVDVNHRGRRINQVLECRTVPGGITQVQQSGWFKTWKVDWRFMEPPDGRGTTVSCQLEAEMAETGLLSLLTPRRLVRVILGGLADDIIRSAQHRLLSLVALGDEPAGSQPEAETLLEVYQTATGLEVWIGGQRYVIPASK